MLEFKTTANYDLWGLDASVFSQDYFFGFFGFFCDHSSSNIYTKDKYKDPVGE